jgi:hypothetical protein
MRDARVGGTRTRAMVFAALVAIPFWSTVGYLVPIVGSWLAPAPSLVSETAPVPAPNLRRLHLRCFEMEAEQAQSLRDCVFWGRPTHPTLMQPGDYPLRGMNGVMMAGDAASPRAL